MERPNKKDYLTTNQIEYNQMLNKYYDDLEAYIDILEKQLILSGVVKPFYCWDKDAGLDKCKEMCDTCGKYKGNGVNQ
tara:strand:+ start:124 stop:357 length:234 start_codon:yes stop_codon:yes gene_type:complete